MCHCSDYTNGMDDRVANIHTFLYIISQARAISHRKRIAKTDYQNMYDTSLFEHHCGLPHAGHMRKALAEK